MNDGNATTCAKLENSELYFDVNMPPFHSEKYVTKFHFEKQYRYDLET